MSGVLVYVYVGGDVDGRVTNEQIGDEGASILIDRGPTGKIVGVEILDATRVTVESVPDE